MPEITSWIGTTWGTNRGSILAELTLDGTQLTGKIQLLEPGVGQTHLKLEGQWTPDHKIHAKLSDFVGTYPVAVFLPQSGEMNAAFDPSENLIHGEWKTDAGTLGKFVLANTSVPITMPQNPAPAIAAPLPQPARIQTPPPALVTLTRVLTSYRLDASALRSLSELVRQDTSIPLSVINGATEGREFIHIGMDSLLADHSLPDVIYEVRVAANEPAVQSGNSTVVVTLKRNDPNILYVSGYNRVWVEGKAAQIETFLRHHQSQGVDKVRRYGNWLNSAIFMAMLAFLPSVPSIRQRLEVVVWVFVLLMVLMYSWKLFANTVVYLRVPKLAWYQKQSGVLLVFLEVGLSAWIAYLVQKFLRH